MQCNSSNASSNNLLKNYCVFLRAQDSQTLVEGVPALLIGVINAVFSLLAMAGNALILAALHRNPSLRTPSYIFLAGLAATDLSTGLITQPIYAAYNIARFSHHKLPCSAITTYHTFDRYLSALTMGAMTLMAIERWLHVANLYKSPLTVKHAYAIFGGLSLIPAISTVGRIWLISNRYFRNVWMPLLRGFISVASSIILAFSYYKVVKAIKRHQRQIHCSQSRQTVVRSTINITKYKKSVQTILIIVIFFLLGFLPSMIFMSLSVLSTPSGNGSFSVLTHISFTLFYLSSSFNPLLYCNRMIEIRNEVKLLIRNMFCRGQPV